MTPMQTAMLNGLLREPRRNFTDDEAAFLVLASRFIRYIIITRKEGYALVKIHGRVVERDPRVDPGIPADFDGLDIAPEPETDLEGGPGMPRPPGAGDGRDPVPDLDNLVRVFGP